MDQNNIKKVLEDLIETCRDGQKGYQDAASHVKRPDLKTYFLDMSLERGRYAEELQGELHRLGDPDKKVSGSVAAALHRTWIDTKVAMGGGDKAILDSLEQGEDKAKEAYKKALENSLPENIAQIVRSQAAGVQRSHDKVKNLRDTAEAAA
jgi:uncharacterized protein (TIGR02284 family)